MPRWRGPALISGIDKTGVAAKFQSQTFEVARYCVRGKVKAKDAEGAELDPMRVRSRSVGPDAGSRQGQWEVDVGMDVDGEDGGRSSSTGISDSASGPNPAAGPAPDPPSLSVELPSPRGPLGKCPD